MPLTWSIKHVTVRCLRFSVHIQYCRAAEEVDAEFGPRGTHSDVWGFATTVLHMATGQQPYHNLSMVQMVSAMTKKQLPNVPETLSAWLQQLLKQCFSFATAARPTVSQLLQVLISDDSEFCTDDEDAYSALLQSQC